MTVAGSQVLGGLPYKYKGCAKMDARSDFPKKHMAFPWKLALMYVVFLLAPLHQEREEFFL